MPEIAQQTLTLPILGMSCAACQHHVEAALRAVEGVAEARVDLMAHRGSVVFDPATTAPENLVEVIRAAGYDAVLPRPGDVARSAEESGNNLGAKVWATLLGGAAAMLLAMPLGAMGEMGRFDHLLMRLLPFLYDLPADGLRWFLLLLTAGLMAWAGASIYRNAWRGLLHGATNMNTLVSLGTGVAFLYSLYATVWPAPGRAIYFDAVLLILGFLLLGKRLEAQAKRHALGALDALSRLRPATARRMVDGQQVVVPLVEIAVGESILVLPGERFPVDATILEGRTTVDESMLTGESTPLAREAGGSVLAGALNYDGAIVCRAESLGDSTVLAQITRMVEQAQGSRASMERLADRASSVFVPAVLVLAVLTFLAWIVFAHSLSLALANMVAVLVIACPCAMGLAVPAALTVAVGRGAQLGVLYKGGEALERLTRLDVLVLDKTGTLTVGRPVLKAVVVLGTGEKTQILRGATYEGDRVPSSLVPSFPDSHKKQAIDFPFLLQDSKAGPSTSPSLRSGSAQDDSSWGALEDASRQILRLAAAAEERSNHPLAHALVDAAKERQLDWPVAEEVQILPGRGLSAKVEGRELLLGNEALFRETYIALPKDISTAEAGVTRLWMAVDGSVAGFFDAMDALRPDAAQAVAALRRAGLRVQMLTGDSAAAAAPIALQAGIEEVEAGLDPAGKLARIRALQEKGLRVAMAGDGINDASALAQADAGIAMGSGADLAQEAGDVILLHPHPGAIPAAILLARATLRIMRQNLIWAAAYNLLGIPLAAGVLYPHFHILLSPWLAAAAMALSSVSVLANSLRLRRWRQ